MQPNAHKRRVRWVRRAVARLEGLVRLVGSQIGSDDHLRAAAGEVVEPLLQALGKADRLILEVKPRDLTFAGEVVSPPAPADESLAAMLSRWKVSRIVIGRKLYARTLLDLCDLLSQRKQLAPGEIVLGAEGPASQPVPLDSVQGLLRGYLEDSSSTLQAVAAASVGASDSSLEAWLHQNAVELPDSGLATTEDESIPRSPDRLAVAPPPRRGRTETPTVASGAKPRRRETDPPERKPKPKPKKKRLKHMTGNTDVKIEGEESWMDKLNDSALDTDVNGLLDDLL